MSRNNKVEVLHNSAFDRAKCAIPIKYVANKGQRFAQKRPRNFVLVQKGFQPIVLLTFPNPMYTACKVENNTTHCITNQPPHHAT